MEKYALQKQLSGYCLHSTNSKKYYISNNDVTHLVGKGTYGVVYRATDQYGNLLAIKQIYKSNSLPNSKIQQEIDLMLKIRQFNHMANLSYAIDTAEDLNSYYIVMPLFCKGNLTEFIATGGIESEQHAVEYFRQIVYGLQILHSNNYIHRDLSSDNILINTYMDKGYPYQCYFAISDFGLAKQYRPNETEFATQSIGACLNSAPEVVNGIFDQKTDIYSLGCIFYKMLTKQELFTYENTETLKKITNNIKLQSCFKIPLSVLSLRILEGCLQFDRNKRISSNDLYDLLNVRNFYKEYTTLSIGSVSTNQNINLQQFNRKLNPDPPLQYTPKKKYKFLSSINIVKPPKTQKQIKFKSVQATNTSFSPNNVLPATYNAKKILTYPSLSLFKYIEPPPIPVKKEPTIPPDAVSTTSQSAKKKGKKVAAIPKRMLLEPVLHLNNNFYENACTCKPIVQTIFICEVTKEMNELLNKFEALLDEFITLPNIKKLAEKHNNSVLMLPESAELITISLYRAVPLPYSLGIILYTMITGSDKLAYEITSSTFRLKFPNDFLNDNRTNILLMNLLEMCLLSYAQNTPLTLKQQITQGRSQQYQYKIPNMSMKDDMYYTAVMKYNKIDLACNQ